MGAHNTSRGLFRLALHDRCAHSSAAFRACFDNMNRTWCAWPLVTFVTSLLGSLLHKAAKWGR